MTQGRESDSEVTLVLTVRPGILISDLVEHLMGSVLDWGDDHPRGDPLTRFEIHAETGEGPKVLSTIWSKR